MKLTDQMTCSAQVRQNCGFGTNVVMYFTERTLLGNPTEIRDRVSVPHNFLESPI